VRRRVQIDSRLSLPKALGYDEQDIFDETTLNKRS
jgi:hypothetical protein